MQKFPDLREFPYQNLVLNSRPDMSLKVEAEVCGLAEIDVACAWQDLEMAENRSDFDAACDQYIKLASVTIAEAAPELRVSPSYLLEVIRDGSTVAFKHRERWRIWRGDLTYFFSVGNFVPPRPKTHRRKFRYLQDW